MILQKNELKNVNIVLSQDQNNNYLKIYYNNQLIHIEKIYTLEYKKRTNKIKDILFFWK